jgi:hypothetical protein
MGRSGFNIGGLVVKLHTASDAATKAIRVIFIILLSLKTVYVENRCIVFQERMNMCE